MHPTASMGESRDGCHTMSFRAGVLRLAKTIKGIGVLSAVAGVIFGNKPSANVPALLIGGVASAVCWAVGWILEGFAKE